MTMVSFTPTPRNHDSLGGQFVSYANSTEGVFNLSMLASTLLDAGAATLKAYQETLITDEQLGMGASKFKVLAEHLSLIKLTTYFVKLPQCFEKPKNESEPTNDEPIDPLKTCIEFTATAAYATALFVSGIACRILGDLASLITDTMDLQSDVENWIDLSGKVAREPNAESSISETKRLLFLKMLKNTMSVAGAVLGFSALLLQPSSALFAAAPIAAEHAALGLGIANYALAILSSLYESNMAFMPVYKDPNYVAQQ